MGEDVRAPLRALRPEEGVELDAWLEQFLGERELSAR